MNELFGLSMTVIATGCVVITAFIFLFIAWIAFRNPVMFKTGLRNIPRRKMQTGLIVVGLMLSTLIITAAFGTGDTLAKSVTNEVYGILGPADEFIEWDTKAFPAPEDQQTIPIETVDAWQKQFVGDGTVRAMFPYLREHIPLQNLRTRLNEANPRITAFRAADVAPFGGLKDTNGRGLALKDDQIALNEDLAGNIDARVGDTVRLFYQGSQLDLKVAAIVPSNLLGGTSDSLNKEGATVTWDFLARTLGREGKADFVAISNSGSERGGLSASSAIAAKIKPVLGGTPYKINETKKDQVRLAELVGNLFTTIFIIFGLFSIAAGVLLIFLIFVMLAAERKPEMGMARAVGAKRRQIVESFLAEGMGYDIGAAIVGLFAGIGVAAAMMLFVKLRIGEDIGVDLRFYVSLRSMIVSFCLGIIVTFIVVFVASWRASRLNIVAAIRDLPESKPYDPERGTWGGYLRASLNAFVAYGVLLVSLTAALYLKALAPLFLLAAVLSVGGPWLAMLREHNFGAPRAKRKDGEGLPKWPWILGVVLLPIGAGLLILIGYPLAMLVVRLTRDRKPARLPVWLIFAGVVVAPLGLVLAALQDRRKPGAGSTGFGAVGLVLGAVMILWGLDSNRMALFGTGVSLVALWAAVTLRYFHIRERLVFTLISFALLIIWYLLPGGRLEFLIGKMDAGPEMFFVTGAVLVTAGTFIVVYNADVILPAIGALGGRFGRILPAVKMAVAYPLQSRFRTGLTIAMIGLIMFVLSVQAALNTNFSNAINGADARGGFDVRADINGNNRSSGLISELNAGNQDPSAPVKVDTNAIAAVGEARYARSFEVDIEDPAWGRLPSGQRNEADRFKHLELQGVDSGFISAQALPLQFRAAGYSTDADVWAALAKDPSLAIAPASLTSERRGFGGDGGEDPLSLPSTATRASFAPFTLNVRNRSTNTVVTITVIGQAKDSAATFWPGLIVQKSFLESTFPTARGQQFFLRLKDGTDSRRFAKNVESVLVQASADSLDAVIEKNAAQNRTFLEMFQGFLALGLLVGIAALGVISLRAVVERRQQIGMLRAIGYKRSMVQLSFMLEAGFIALSGIILGLGLGLSFAANLFTSGEFGETAKGTSFTIPWAQVGLVTAFAFVAAMVMTYLPARAASHVAVAEALRYE